MSLKMVGRLGGAFNITGEGFGEKGTLFLSDRQITTTRWDDADIRGQLPEDLKAGKIIVKIHDENGVPVKEQTGTFDLKDKTVVVPVVPHTPVPAAAAK